MDKTELEKKLVVGARIKIGPLYCDRDGSWDFQAGQIIELAEGSFEYENGLYTELQTAPSSWFEIDNDFYSIYHMFGNELDEFCDCEILEPGWEPTDG